MTSSDLFAHDSILPSDPVDEGGAPLEVLHDREYRVRAYRKGADRLLIRGAIRDQKPPHLYIDVDPDPLTIHHMQFDIEVGYPSLEIVAANVVFETHPNTECPSIVTHYDKLVGLSIARGFTHKVRELFGGPRGCTHVSMLLQAMAPVAMQCLWSMQASAARRSGTDDQQPSQTVPRSELWKMNLNTCHVWAEDSAFVDSIQHGKTLPPPPLFVEPRLVSLGLKPEDWRKQMGG